MTDCSVLLVADYSHGVVLMDGPFISDCSHVEDVNLFHQMLFGYNSNRFNSSAATPG